MGRQPLAALFALAVVAGGCRIGFDEGANVDGGSVADAGGSDASQAVDGEDITLAPGWEVSVWREFSDDFTYEAVVFTDAITSYSNTPIGLMVLDGDFDAGLAVLTAHTIIELSASGTYSERNFFGATADGPDAMWDAVYCGTAVSGVSSICVAATSEGGGDGLFAIATDWTMSTVASVNNSHSLAYDPAGLFDSLGGERLYEETGGTVRLVDGAAVINDSASTMAVLPSGDMLLSRPGGPTSQLVRIGSVSHAPAELDSRPAPAVPFSYARQTAFVVVRGQTGGIDGDAHAIAATQELVAYSGGGQSVLASTDPADGWQWISAVAVEPAHELGGPTTQLFVLESNRTANRDRILRLVSP